VPIPLGIRLTIPERRAIIRKLSAQGVTVGRLVELFDVSDSAVYRYLGSSTPFKHDLDSVAEAGLAWYMRYGTLPSSEAWNSSLAQADECLPRPKDQVPAYERYLAGYHPILEPSVLRAWPRPDEIARLYRSRKRKGMSAFETFRDDVRNEIGRRKRAGDPYNPVPLSPAHEFGCILRGVSPSLPFAIRADVDGQTRRVDWFRGLLCVAGLIDFAEQVYGLDGPASGRLADTTRHALPSPAAAGAIAKARSNGLAAHGRVSDGPHDGACSGNL